MAKRRGAEELRENEAAADGEAVREELTVGTREQRRGEHGADAESTHSATLRQLQACE